MVPTRMELQNDHLPYGPEDPRDDGLTNTYQYTPITNSGDTRLLRLLPSAQQDAPIRCSLFHYSPPPSVSLGTDPYEALSYVWGNELHRRAILIDQYWFEVTVNLYDVMPLQAFGIQSSNGFCGWMLYALTNKTMSKRASRSHLWPAFMPGRTASSYGLGRQLAEAMRPWKSYPALVLGNLVIGPATPE